MAAAAPAIALFQDELAKAAPALLAEPRVAEYLALGRDNRGARLPSRHRRPGQLTLQPRVFDPSHHHSRDIAPGPIGADRPRRGVALRCGAERGALDACDRRVVVTPVYSFANNDVLIPQPVDVFKLLFPNAKEKFPTPPILAHLWPRIFDVCRHIGRVFVIAAEELDKLDSKSPFFLAELLANSKLNGSATIIGKRYIVTASHVCQPIAKFKSGEWVWLFAPSFVNFNNINVFPDLQDFCKSSVGGLAGCQFSPFGIYKVTHLWSSTAAPSASSLLNPCAGAKYAAHDLAVGAVWPPFPPSLPGMVLDSKFAGKSGWAAGYAGVLGPVFGTVCQFSAPWFCDDDPDVIEFGCNTTFGQSGGPLYAEVGGTGHIYGVISNMLNNLGVKNHYAVGGAKMIAYFNAMKAFAP